MHAPFSRRRLLLAALVLNPLALALAQAGDAYANTRWDELVPRDWDPMKSFRHLQQLALLPDSDPRVQSMYERMRKVWDEAPTVSSLAGRAMKIPGYVVPLESGPAGLREFLLVPYFGACIHIPPPPANQIIHVHVDKPVKGFKTMSAVWVSGTLGLERSDSDMGVSGYSMKAVRIEKYEETAQ